MIITDFGNSVEGTAGYIEVHFICIKLWLIFINTSTPDDVINMIIKHISS